MVQSAAKAIKLAINEAGIKPEDVDYVMRMVPLHLPMKGKQAIVSVPKKKFLYHLLNHLDALVLLVRLKRAISKRFVWLVPNYSAKNCLTISEALFMVKDQEADIQYAISNTTLVLEDTICSDTLNVGRVNS